MSALLAVALLVIGITVGLVVAPTVAPSVHAVTVAVIRVLRGRDRRRCESCPVTTEPIPEIATPGRTPLTLAE